jgi:Domain of unknown function (DUF4440)
MSGESNSRANGGIATRIADAIAVKTMMGKRSLGGWLLALLVLVGTGDSQKTGTPTDSHAAPAEALIALTQRLLDAVGSGDKNVWREHLADDCIITGDDGRTLTKTEFLEELSPLPPGYSGSISVQNPQVRLSNDAAVLSYDLLEHETVYGQSLTTEYHTTDTWVLRGKQWRLLASQALRKFANPPPGLVNRAMYDNYTGTYELAAGVEYVVSVEDGALIGQRTGRKKEELVPETPDVFFRKGIPGRRIFLRDSDGNVVKMADRLESRDLVWVKKAPALR